MSGRAPAGAPRRPYIPPLQAGPTAGSIERRHLVLVWGVGTIGLGLVVAFLLSAGDLRTVVLLMLTVLGLLCLSPRRGAFILLAFLPFMYFLRRQVLYFNEFSQRDPILLFPHVVTIAMTLGVIIFYSDRLYRYFSRSALMKLLMLQQLVFILQMFNPLQGSVLVGIAGAIYFIIPMLWVFIGMLLDRREIERVLKLVVVVGTITALYGIYQHYFGFSDVELYELQSKKFLKTFGDRPRIMSTFAGLTDFSLYLAISGGLAFAHYWRSKKSLVYLAVLGVATIAMLWVASRTSILLLAFSIVAFLIVCSNRPGAIVVRGLVALLALGALYGYFYRMSPEEIYQAHGSSDPFIAHTISGVTRPTDESTFQVRLGIWEHTLSTAFTENPFGHGLGSTTTAAMKFEGSKMYEAESYFFELIWGSGVLAAVIFALIMVAFFRGAIALSLRPGDTFAHRAIIGVMAAFLLGSLFGVSMRDTISAPLAWLCMGWTVRELVDGEPAVAPEEPPRG